MSENSQQLDDDDLLIEFVDVPSCEISYHSCPKRISYFINLCFEKNLPIDITVHGICLKADPPCSLIPVTFVFEEDDRDLVNWAIKKTEKHVPL